MKAILDKVETSFIMAMKGEEKISRVIYIWGVIGWLVAYFIANRLIKIIDVQIIDFAICIVISAYFVWHIYVTKKCAPKKEKLSKEEKKKLKMEGRNNGSFMRKFLLQESITKWDPVKFSYVVDVFCIAQFMGYIF